MKNIFLVLFLLITVSTYSATIYSSGDGDWEAGATWVGGVEPTDNDIIVINAGHTVSLGNRIVLTGVTIEIGGELYLYDGPGATNDTQGRLVIDDASVIYILETGSVTAEAASAAYALIERTGAGGATTYWDSSAGDLEGPATVDDDNGLVYIIPDDYVPLPIELVSFVVTQNGVGIEVTWVTATEENNDFFTIERTENGVDFEMVNYEQGAGNSSVSLHYSFVDYPPYVGTYYYRLKQTDYNGDFSYSDIVSINYNGADELSGMKIYYADNEVKVILAKVFGSVKLSLYDIQGTHLLTTNYNDVSDFSLPVDSGLGLVFAVVEYGNGEIDTERLYIGH